MLKKLIQASAGEAVPELIRWRRHLHAHPELSFREYNTSAYVQSVLDHHGIAWRTMADTGVVAIITGALPSDKVVALRADMDALPIHEQNEVTYKSTSEGVMHACGHDVHTASLLGVAVMLQSIREKFGGTIKLIFQPGEECLPGGATLMIRDGVLKDPVPTAIIGQHVMPTIPVGKVGFRKGKHMASMDELRLTVRGRGGHGAQPQDNIDPVLIASHIVVALQQVVSRMTNPFTPAVVSFGKMIANGAINIIPDEVYLEGTFRTFDETWRQEAHVEMKKIAEATARSMGGNCSFTINTGYPLLFNNEALTEELSGYASEYLEPEQVIALDPWMASEDFAYYSQQAQGCFYMLGVRNEAKNITAALHTAVFDIDEAALEISVGLMTYLALRRLGNS